MMEDEMKPKAILMTLPILLVATVVCFAQNPQIGTWKLNESKSKIPAGAAKNHTVVYEVAGDSVKITVDGVDGSGATTHSEWTGKFDGKDYPATGDPNGDTRVYKLINSRTLTFSSKKAGKVTLSGRIVVSRDGKTRTVTTTATDDKGKKVTSVAVYDKQ
jgi:hypothetical protein